MRDAKAHSRHNQLVHISRKPTKEATESKYSIGTEKTWLPPEDVAEFAIERLKRRECQQVATSSVRIKEYCIQIFVKDSTHDVATQDVLFSALSSLPIFP